MSEEVRAGPQGGPTALVLDSGVGGLSVLGAIRRRRPDLALAYVADHAFYPYGTRPEEAVADRVVAVAEAAARRLRPDILVVACNTASTVALPGLRAGLAIPVVGTVPAVKPAAAASRTRTIGLLGTPGTVRRAYTRELIEEFAADCRVVAHGSRVLVDLAEAKLAGQAVDPAALATELDGLFAQPGGEAVDVVILACTHFPLLGAELAGAAPRPVIWIDSGDAIARRVDQLLGPATKRGMAPPGVFLTTSGRPVPQALQRALPDFGLRQVDRLIV